MGVLTIVLSSDLKKMDIEAVLVSRTKRHLSQSVTSDSNGGLEIKTEQLLVVEELILKLTDMLKIELVPADDIYLDKKGFTWSLISFEGEKISF